MVLRKPRTRGNPKMAHFKRENKWALWSPSRINDGHLRSIVGQIVDFERQKLDLN